MTNKYYRLLTGAALALTLGTSAYAASPMLKKVDLDNDGLISLSEFTSASNQKFADMDADTNGFVTKEERKAFRESKRAERRDKHFETADTNADGVISKDEHTAAMSNRDERLKSKRDVNGDGTVTKEDRQAMREKRKERRAQRREQRSEGSGEGRGRQNPDVNNDGMIDLAEHQTATAQAFSQLDLNSNGYLEADEQRQKRRRNKHRGNGR